MDIIIRDVEEKDGRYKIYNKDGTGGHWYITKESAEQFSGQIEPRVSQAVPQAKPEPNANEQKMFFDSAKDKILASLLKDIPYWDLKNDDINECIENVKELFASM